MNHSEYEKILALLPSTYSKCCQSCRWVFKQPAGVLMLFKQKEQESYFRLKQYLKRNNMELPIEAIATTATLATAYRFHRIVTKLDPGGDDDKERFEALAEVDKIHLEMTRKQKVRPQIERLKTIQSTIKLMVEEGRSLRGMAEHILTKHRLSVSHTTLQTFIRENFIIVEEGEDGNDA